MILRVFKATVRADKTSCAYTDFDCESWEVREGILVVLREGDLHDVFLPLLNIEAFHELMKQDKGRNIA